MKRSERCTLPFYAILHSRSYNQGNFLDIMKLPKIITLFYKNQENYEAGMFLFFGKLRLKLFFFCSHFLLLNFTWVLSGVHLEPKGVKDFNLCLKLCWWIENNTIEIYIFSLSMFLFCSYFWGIVSLIVLIKSFL